MNRLGTIGKVLQLKENREEEIECEVRALRNAVNADQTRLGILESNYMDTLETFNRKQREGGLAPHEMGIYYSYFFHLDREMEEKKAEIARVLTELDARQGDLVEAHMETRVVESLKDRRSREYEREDARRELKEMDFISSTRRVGQ
ncbi:MAG: flagellar export protein FliJ [Deltaproteobacteria bacterium CG2_30_66_27]|nr:MAG: flagellar export protein FliJ [Deltaproteobacteria bacterium CG2_30_66_27]PJB30847.1 MAG: flagellar export protein FliJ [Deltaproteobacteria bacterium CG_4_9_14_3_um_filter_65_9]